MLVDGGKETNRRNGSLIFILKPKPPYIRLKASMFNFSGVMTGGASYLLGSSGRHGGTYKVVRSQAHIIYTASN